MNRISKLGQKFRQEIQVYRRVLGDPRAPRRTRWLLAAAIAYALSPIDLIPDFIPLVGHLDDAIILPLLVWLALRATPAALLAEHRAEIEKLSGSCIHSTTSTSSSARKFVAATIFPPLRTTTATQGRLVESSNASADSTSATVSSVPSVGMESGMRRVRPLSGTPVSCGCRPVQNAARAGMQTGHGV